MFHARTPMGRRYPTRCLAQLAIAACLTLVVGSFAPADEALDLVAVEAQPLAANVARLVEALDSLGAPLAGETAEAVAAAVKARDAAAIQRAIDPQVAFVVRINPEVRTSVERGPATVTLQQRAYTPILVKVVNQSTVTSRLSIASPQAGAPYGGAAANSLERQQQTRLASATATDPRDGFLALEMYAEPPMTDRLSGLDLEYAIALVYSSDAGTREATIGFDVGQGNQDIGFRGQAPILFRIRPAVPVRLAIADHDGSPTIARLVFRDTAGHVYPPQAKRLAPDFFFQPQIYRRTGDVIYLPPGEMTVEYSRGPEYRVLRKTFTVPAASAASKGPSSAPDASAPEPMELLLDLERWVNPRDYGFYSGDHHIHAAGCAHYTSPTEGVAPADMFQQVKGEGLNVGCVLTWGPCYDYQRRFFSPVIDEVSEPLTVVKYDLEISGFGSQALGHVCLLNLKDQTYPGSEGTSTKGWPTWTTPVLRWAKAQGGTTGYAHSSGGLEIEPESAAARLLEKLDADGDGGVSRDEAAAGLLTEPFDTIDHGSDGYLSQSELAASHRRAAAELPNLAVPEMNGSGAQEVCVSTALGACDFISSMDTWRTAEWNCWYHIMNCGFPLATSGETDFPCMSSTRVGQGRVYVQLGQVDRVDFAAWCKALGTGRSYVSDGYAHALRFEVAAGEQAATAGGKLQLESPAEIEIHATVAFAPETPEGVAHGTLDVPAGRAIAGDTRVLHAAPSTTMIAGEPRLVEVVVNGRAVARREVAADGNEHELSFKVPIARSSWVAVRQFPQLHTNVVRVIVAGQPIRASRASAQWCQAVIEQLWRARGTRIAEHERDAARRAFDQATAIYQKVEAECAPGT